MKTVYLSVRLKNYVNALALVGAPLAETPKNADVLLLPGGGDMHPRFYGQALNGSEDLDEARDARELTLIDNFLCAGKPVIGICRGLQVLNVYFGGTLRQHIEGHSQIDGVDRLHAINTAPGLLRELYGTRCMSTVHTIRPSGGWGRGFRSSPARRTARSRPSATGRSPSLPCSGILSGCAARSRGRKVLTVQGFCALYSDNIKKCRKILKKR